MEYTATEFTPWLGLAGGALIGLSSGLLLSLIGRIAGISGIASGLLSTKMSDIGWRVAFIFGLLVAAVVYPLISGARLPVDIQENWQIMLLGGFLVGFGTRMASGCTAGHGISGLSRLSFRSLAATATFFATAAITVWLVRHGLK